MDLKKVLGGLAAAAALWVGARGAIGGAAPTPVPTATPTAVATVAVVVPTRAPTIAPTPRLSPSPTPSKPSSVPAPGLRKVCARTSKIGDAEMLVKSEASDHITNPLDRRTTGYTLVCNDICPERISRKGKTAFYYSDGVKAGELGYYGTFFGNGKPRAYGAAGGAPQHFAAEISKAASTKGRDGTLYLLMTQVREGSATSCKRFNATGRTGSVR